MKTVKKRKIKKRSLLVLGIVLIILFLIVFYVFNFHITNIYISGNDIYTDQEIIDMAKLSNYPRTLNNNEFVIKNRLEKDPYIKKVVVRKKNWFRSVYIEVIENKPIIIYQNQTILQDGTSSNDKFNIPVLINEVNNHKVYSKLLNSLCEIKSDILERISEIKYDPNNVDKERFLLYMSDGNNVYITLRKINRIENYVEIISAFNGQKGTLYLDSGEYFEVFGGKNE